MTAEEVLVQCEIMLMEVGHDLDRWKRELDQVRYASHLDKIIEWQMDKPVEDLDKTVPLVVYERGNRREVGFAKVSLTTGDVMATFTDDYYAGYLQAQPKGSYSIGYDENRQAMRVRPVPYDRRKIVNPHGELLGMTPAEIRKLYGTAVGNAMGITANLIRVMNGLDDPEQERINKFMKENPDGD